MNDRLPHPLSQLRNALRALEEASAEDPDPKRFLIDATIQRFEFTFELYWKAAKRALAFEGITANSPRETLVHAYAQGWIDDEQTWLSMMKDRNLSSHTYNELLADEVYERITSYIPVLRSAVETLANLDV